MWKWEYKRNILSGRYCGSEIPHPVTSFSNSLVVNFITDHSVSGKGFRATFSASTSSKTHYDTLLTLVYSKVKRILFWHLASFSKQHILLALSTQVVVEIWWWRLVRLTVLTIQMLIRLTWSVCGPSEAHQEIVSSFHLCKFECGGSRMNLYTVCDYDWGSFQTYNLLVSCSVPFTSREMLAVKMTIWKSERATPLGNWLVAFAEPRSPPTTPLWLVTSCGLSLSQMQHSVELDSEPPSHTVSVMSPTQTPLYLLNACTWLYLSLMWQSQWNI